MTGILREGRALDAAKRLGQVLGARFGGRRLFYVMPYVPGMCWTITSPSCTAYEKGSGLIPPEAALDPLRPNQLQRGADPCNWTC